MHFENLKLKGGGGGRVLLLLLLVSSCFCYCSSYFVCSTFIGLLLLSSCYFPCLCYPLLLVVNVFPSHISFDSAV